MSDASYDLLFRGELLPDQAPETVRAAVQHLLKLDAAKLDQLFSGQPVYLRRAADRETAARFQTAFKQAGARLRVLPTGAAMSEVVAPPANAPVTNAIANPSSVAPKKKLTLAERLAAESAAQAAEDGAPSLPPQRAPQTASAPAQASVTMPSRASATPRPGFGAPAGIQSGPFEVAPIGADVLRPEERRIVNPVDIRIDHLSLVEQSGWLTEPEMQMELIIDLDHISLAELGANLGEQRASIAPVVAAPNLDIAPVGVLLALQPPITQARVVSTEHLSIAPLGADLGNAVRDRRHGIAPPKTDHLRLQ